MDCTDTRHLFLRCSILITCGRDLVGAIFSATKGEQISETLNAIHELGLDIGALGDETLPGFAANDLGEEWQNQTQSEEKGNKDKSNKRVERNEEDGYADHDEYRSQ